MEPVIEIRRHRGKPAEMSIGVEKTLSLGCDGEGKAPARNTKLPRRPTTSLDACQSLGSHPTRKSEPCSRPPRRHMAQSITVSQRKRDVIAQQGCPPFGTTSCFAE